YGIGIIRVLWQFSKPEGDDSDATKNHQLAAQPAAIRTALNDSDSPDGRRRLFLRGHTEVRLRQPEHRTLHQDRPAGTGANGAFRGRTGDRRQTAGDVRVADSPHLGAVHHRDDRSDSVHKSDVVSGNVATPTSTNATTGRHLN